tara:strand:- start:314 stop:640 length:327 start_codon:yes stop_codon:yes gene_type:complete
MSVMKDYYMWLEHKGYSADDSADADLVNEYKNDADWHQTEPTPAGLVRLDDGDYIVEDDDDGYVIDDGDYDGPDMGWTPEDQWFRADGGLTGEAWDFLATTDSQGDFI